MRSVSTLYFVAAVWSLLAANPSEAFVKGSAISRSCPYNTELHMAATKKAAKKKAAKKATAKKGAGTMETMRKAEIVAEVAEKMNSSKAGAEEALNAVLTTIQDNVAAGKKVSLPGFGNFQMKSRAARKGRNPQTGEEIDIKASNSPGFSAAKAFKDALN